MGPPPNGLGRQLGLRAREATRRRGLRETQILPLVPVDGHLHAGYAGTSGSKQHRPRAARAARAVRPPPVFSGRAVGRAFLRGVVVVVAAPRSVPRRLFLKLQV